MKRKGNTAIGSDQKNISTFLRFSQHNEPAIRKSNGSESNSDTRDTGISLKNVQPKEKNAAARFNNLIVLPDPNEDRPE